MGLALILENWFLTRELVWNSGVEESRREGKRRYIYRRKPC
jgi:hypothetical protein